MVDLTCAPACTQNTPLSLPVGPPAASSSLGADCTTPLFVTLCNTSEFDKSILCDPVTGATVILVTTYSTAGVPSSVAYNADGSSYIGAISALVSCGGNTLESDALQMCDAGVSFVRWVVKDAGVPTGVVFDTTISGTPYVTTGIVSVGACDACPAIPPVGVVSSWG
jgi:hypothetical protein